MSPKGLNSLYITKYTKILTILSLEVDAKVDIGYKLTGTGRLLGQVQVLAAAVGAFQTALFLRRSHYLIRGNFFQGRALTTSPIQIKLCEDTIYRTMDSKCVAIPLRVSNFPTE
ncbi:hypothetical protein WA026_003963 [Henosepilachna vigintioctopunctata]|uniref:Uncharacterized protein n=1 Tax=Henosepilachna vigintioctopunctata TaxID=420089 RepID=A0AAW1UDQ8_9CUCU